MSRKSNSSTADFLWTPGFVFAMVILMYKLNKTMDVLDAQTILGGVVIGLLGAIAGIFLKRISAELPLIQRVAVLIAIIIVAIFIW